MNAIAENVLSRGGQVSYVRMDDLTQREPLAALPEVQIHDIPVIRKTTPFSILRQQRQFRNRFREHLIQHPPNVVHTNFCLPGSVARKLAKEEFGLPVVTTCHELFTSMRLHLRSGVKRTEKFADKIVYISNAVAESYGAKNVADHLPADGKRAVIYNGVDVEQILQIARRVKRCVPHRIVSVGRLVPLKGQAQVIRALPMLVERFPDLSYRLIGDGPERSNLARLAEELGVGSHIEFAGWLEHKRAIVEMASAGAIAMTSLQEGFGLAVVEALCCRRPICITRIDAFREIIHKTGDMTSTHFFDAGDIQCLADHISRIFTDNERDFCGENIVRRIRKEFSVATMADGYLNLYGQLLEHAPESPASVSNDSDGVADRTDQPQTDNS